MGKKIIISKAVKRKKGMLYFIDGKGNVVETSMKRRKKRK